MQIKAIILGADKPLQPDEMPMLLRPICGTPIIRHLTGTLEQLGIKDISVVINSIDDKMKQAINPHKHFFQPVRLGTGHAVSMASEALKPFDGCALILFGDTPLIRATTIQKMIDKCQGGADVVALAFIPTDGRRYGRVIINNDGLCDIIEYKEANDAQRTIRLCNAGALCVNGRHILSLIKKIKNDNSTGEYYITQIVKLARLAGLSTDIVIGASEELHGINSPEELMAAEELFLQHQIQGKK